MEHGMTDEINSRTFSIRAALFRPVSLPDHLLRRYRGATWGLFLGLMYMAFWFNATGMSWGVVILFLCMYVILAVGIAKIIVESSVLTVDSPVSAQTFVMQSFGSASITQEAMVGLVLSYVVIRFTHGTMLAQAAFGSKMGDEHGVPRGKLYGAMGLGVIVAIVVAVGTVFYLAYNVGAFNFQSHAFTLGHVEAYSTLARKTDAQFGPDWTRLGFFGFGMSLMYVVLMIRTRMASFWLHPVGLAFATTAGYLTISIFLTWLIKTALMKVGGNRLVKNAQPLFLGFVCGQAMGVALGLVVDTIWFPGQGHRITTGW
jgi:hypothetical protein